MEIIIWPGLLSLRPEAEHAPPPDRGWKTVHPSEQRELNIHQRRLFPPNGATRRCSRAELRSIDTDRNVERRDQRRLLRCHRLVDTRGWLRNGPVLLSLDLPPDFVCGFANPSFGYEFARHRREHVIILFERLQPFSTK